MRNLLRSGGLFALSVSNATEAHHSGFGVVTRRRTLTTSQTVSVSPQFSTLRTVSYDCGVSRAVVRCIVGFCLVFAPIASASERAVPPSGITVRDSIEMTRLVDPSPSLRSSFDRSIEFSPKRTHFAVVTQKGNLARDTLIHEVLVFNVEEVRAYLNGNEPLDTSLGYSVISFESTPVNVGTSRPPGISRLRWISDSTIAFVAQSEDSPNQVYSVDVSTRELTQLTNHDRHIRRFDISADLSTLVFVADADGVDRTETDLRGYAVESRPLYLSLERDPSSSETFDEAFFSLDMSTGTSTMLTSPGHPLYRSRGPWVSPNGRRAIALAYATDIPADWLVEYSQYQSIGPAIRDYGNNPAIDTPRTRVFQYALIDTVTGEIGPLLRAPITFGHHAVHWTSDGERAIVSNTYLPLDDVNASELERRRGSSWVVEIDIDTGQLAPIHSHPTGGGSLLGMQRPSDSLLVVQYRRPDRQGDVSLLYRQSESGQWLLQDSGAPPGTTSSFSVFIQQDVDTPPDLAATDHTTRQTKLITSFNPMLSAKIVDRVEHFEWTDRNNRSWEGGLLYPPDYHSDQRYPLVIQTYGYSPDQFLLDGASTITSAFAARPIADTGIIVLQMAIQPSSNPSPLRGQEHGPGYAAGFDGAVRALDERGLIDPRRVGLIGWSRTGLHVSYAVTFSEHIFTAATIADSTSIGLTTYMQMFGMSAPGMFGIEKAVGAPFWAEDRSLWLDKAPNLNAHRVRTALRFESYGTYLNPYWDLYTTLKRHYRPAEMFHIPVASHNLQRPLARYGSQQGNVDWFAFWLKGYEDPDPEKAAQYDRWRSMRDRYCVILAEEGEQNSPWYCDVELPTQVRNQTKPTQVE